MCRNAAKSVSQSDMVDAFPDCRHKNLFLFVEKSGQGSLTADDITTVRQLKFDCRQRSMQSTLRSS